MNFQTQHLATLAKYGGISFIAGAVNHGMFSEQRALMTAAVGVVLYVLGAGLELRATPHGKLRWLDLLGFGALASIGLGFFTGGLQHFPDSPTRSLWVVPTGFFLSLVAMFFVNRQAPQNPAATMRATLVYGAAAGLLVVLGSWAAAQLLQGRSAADHGAHAHGHAQGHEQAGPATPAVRNVVIELDDSMRFTPANWQAQAGEQLRLVVVNKGKLQHELVVGQAAELQTHAQMMKDAAPGHHHHGDNSVSVAPGQTAELLWTFDKTGTWGMACFEPGHYEAGMKGSVEVKARPG
jgi:uncharacterized cupredoxin-like copper-binding protein